jgi:pyridinium-3,5-bisthiocarboxylic acid mononucleotide nickel chelatase
VNILYLQCHAGISGDMFLGALLDAGLEQTAFRDMLHATGIADDEVKIEKIVKKGISATHVTVIPRADRRHLHVADIRKTISDSGLNGDVIERALSAFERIVQAESQVHGVSMENVHLHEVSGLDTIVDILGVSWALNNLKIEKVFSTPLNTGSGTVTFSHGVVPVPAPATALLLTNIPVTVDGLPGERTTPTGAALAAEFVHSFDSPGTIVPLQTGYGAGSRDDGDRPNVLRAMICRSFQDNGDDTAVRESLVMLETDSDDDTPEVLGYCMEKLQSFEGVLDVSLIATLRKKNRPGHLLRVLCRHTAAADVQKLVFAETGTLGIREIQVARTRLQRQIDTVDTPWGPVRVTRAGGTISPEYEDCRTCARDHAVPLKHVYDAARAAIIGGGRTRTE